MDMYFEIFLQGKVHKSDGISAFINNDETETALEDAGHGWYKVFVWTCTLRLYGKSSLEPFWI